MTRLLRLIAGCAALAPAAALAQEPRQIPPGAARAEGDALLAQAQAGAFFDNVTADDSGAVRLKHKASGLICVFNAGESANRLYVFDGATGEDIACATGGEAGERILYASHTPGRTLADAFAHDVAEVKKSHPDIADYVLPKGVDSPVLDLLAVPPMPPSKTARFVAEHKFTSVSSAVYKDWSLEFRFTCPEEQQDVCADTLQPTLWASILSQISGAPMDLPSSRQSV